MALPNGDPNKLTNRAKESCLFRLNSPPLDQVVRSTPPHSPHFNEGGEEKVELLGLVVNNPFNNLDFLSDGGG